MTGWSSAVVPNLFVLWPIKVKYGLIHLFPGYGLSVISESELAVLANYVHIYKTFY